MSGATLAVMVILTKNNIESIYYNFFHERYQDNYREMNEYYEKR